MITMCQNGTQFVQETSPSKKIKALNLEKVLYKIPTFGLKLHFFLIFSVIGLDWGGRGVGE